MGSSRSGLLAKKPKELLPLPPRQRLQQRPDQSLDLGLTVFWRPGSRIFEGLSPLIETRSAGPADESGEG
jgi:hypothetical protein